jgi:hypothetical protein
MMTDSDLDAIAGHTQRFKTDMKLAAIALLRFLHVTSAATAVGIPWAIGWVIGKAFRALIVALTAVIYSIGHSVGKLWRWTILAGLVIRKGYWDGLGAQTKPKKPSR